MADVENIIIGISSAVCGIVSFIFYRRYSFENERARELRNIPIWHADVKLYDHLKMQDNHCLAYAAVEGKVTDLGRDFLSYHGPYKGVIIRSRIVEHKSKRIDGVWRRMKRTIRDKTEMVPFGITKPGGDPEFIIKVTEPNLASYLLYELETTYNRMEPNKDSIIQIGLDRLLGEVIRGYHVTEQMLLTGTSILGIGKVFIEYGQMKLAPPDDSYREYIITRMRLRELVWIHESQSAVFKVLTIIMECFAGSLLICFIHGLVADWLERRKRRLEEIRRATAEQRRRLEREQNENNDIPN